MTQNLAEFLKVLTVVVTWTVCLTVGRHYMLSLDETDAEEEENKDEEL